MMFRKYGFVGILLILFVELNFILDLQPFAKLYFPIVWLGYILVIDALVYKIRKNSLISSRFSEFLGMVIISMLFWWIFEFLNLPIQNWRYPGLELLDTKMILFGILSFATVLPAFFETVELYRSIHLFDNKKLHKSHKITKRFIHTMLTIGIISFILPIILPRYFFPLVWGSLFFILDPINYLHKQPSIIGHLKDKNLAIPLTLLLTGITLGFFWEFWNYWAAIKWTYSIPYVSYFKIFEMPALGYLGCFPFAFELYAMYWFVRSLFLKKDNLLVS